MSYDHEDDFFKHEIDQVAEKVEMTVPVSVSVPTQKEVAGEIARHIIHSYADVRRYREIAESTVRQTVEKHVGEAMGQIIQDMIKTPMTRTDTFGNPLGEPITLATVIEETAKSYLTTIVDNDGKPTNQTGYGAKKLTRAEWLMGQVANKEFDRQIQNEIAKIKAQVNTNLAQILVGGIVEKLNGMVLK